MSASPDQGAEFLFSADDVEYELVLDENGDPVDGAIEEISVERISPAMHSRFGPDDVRIYAICRALRTGQLVLKVWCLTCGGCSRRTGARCTAPRPKKGAAGYLRRDAFVALGRRLTAKERIAQNIFLGRIFTARLYAVRNDDEGQARQRGAWYSKVGEFLTADGAHTP